MRQVYLDHAATTPMRAEVIETVHHHCRETIGNPSSLHSFGQRAKRVLEEARGIIAGALGAHAGEIYFTSGGTESLNLAIQGAAVARRERGRHLITSRIEHHAALHTFQALGKQGYEVTYLPVDYHSLVDLDALRQALRRDTILISVMLANNEVGTIQPLAEISALAREQGVLVATDAVQAVGKLPLRADELGVDLLALTGHKLYGPKGAGALYVRRGVTIAPLMHGGHQERLLRPGTENIPAIAGLATAVRLSCAEMADESPRLAALRDRLEAGVLQSIPDVSVNGHPERRVASISNISFAGVEGEALLLALDTLGIAVSTGSACAAGSQEPSHVLQAMGVAPALASGALRFSLGRGTGQDDVDYVLDSLAEVAQRLREHTPQ